MKSILSLHSNVPKVTLVKAKVLLTHLAINCCPNSTGMLVSHCINHIPTNWNLHTRLLRMYTARIIDTRTSWNIVLDLNIASQSYHIMKQNFNK